jgi:hypothetical protein
MTTFVIGDSGGARCSSDRQIDDGTVKVEGKKACYNEGRTKNACF